MKKLFLGMLLIALTLNLSAQEKGKIRVGFDLGLGLPTMGAGFGGDLDVRYNVMDNVNVGIKLGADALFKDIYVDQLNSTASITACAISSTLATGDYYFNKGTSIFAPYLGGGLGFYEIGNIKVSASGTSVPTTPTNTSTFLTENKFGGLLRGGFELGHFRMGLEYYLIPDSKLVDMNNVALGTTPNSYLKISLGFYFGGGHWRKATPAN